MLLTFIENLKRQPKDVRKNYTLLIASGATLIIVCFYLLAMYFGALGTRSRNIETEEVKKNTTTGDLFNASNVFYDKGNVDAEKTNTNTGWAEQLRSLNEEFMNNRLPGEQQENQQ